VVEAGFGSNETHKIDTDKPYAPRTYGPSRLPKKLDDLWHENLGKEGLQTRSNGPSSRLLRCRLGTGRQQYAVDLGVDEPIVETSDFGTQS
jgi:hypothetical protein